MLILLILLAMFLVWILCKSASTVELECKADCKYFRRNCTQDPCIICEKCSEYVKSEMDGQELD
jgi:hypothetical protein